MTVNPFPLTRAAFAEYYAGPPTEVKAAKVREAFWIETGAYPDTRAACNAMDLSRINHVIGKALKSN